MFLWLLLGLAAAAVVGGGGPRVPGNAKPLVPPRAKEPWDPGDTGGLVVWGKSESDTSATYRPTYLKWKGCFNWQWGLCFKDYIDQLGHKNTPRFQAGMDNLMQLIKWVFPAAAVSEWLLKNICLLFNFPLSEWGDEYGNTAWEVARRDEPLLSVGVPPSPLPQRTGWHRVWIRKNPSASSTRNETTIRFFFPSNNDYPENTKSIEIEVMGSAEIKGMLRLDPDYTGALTPKQLAGATCGSKPAKFWQTTRGKAMAAFK